MEKENQDSAIWHGGGAETTHWFLKMLPCKNERAKQYKFFWLFLTMYEQPHEKKIWAQNFFVYAPEGSKKNFGPPEKKYDKKIASDPNFFLIKW